MRKTSTKIRENYYGCQQLPHRWNQKSQCEAMEGWLPGGSVK